MIVLLKIYGVELKKKNSQWDGSFEHTKQIV